MGPIIEELRGWTEIFQWPCSFRGDRYAAVIWAKLIDSGLGCKGHKRSIPWDFSPGLSNYNATCWMYSGPRLKKKPDVIHAVWACKIYGDEETSALALLWGFKSSNRVINKVMISRTALCGFHFWSLEDSEISGCLSEKSQNLVIYYGNNYPLQFSPNPQKRVWTPVWFQSQLKVQTDSYLN